MERATADPARPGRAARRRRPCTARWTPQRRRDHLPAAPRPAPPLARVRGDGRRAAHRQLPPGRGRVDRSTSTVVRWTERAAVQRARSARANGGHLAEAARAGRASAVPRGDRGGALGVARRRTRRATRSGSWRRRASTCQACSGTHPAHHLRGRASSLVLGHERYKGGIAGALRVRPPRPRRMHARLRGARPTGRRRSRLRLTEPGRPAARADRSTGRRREAAPGAPRARARKARRTACSRADGETPAVVRAPTTVAPRAELRAPRGQIVRIRPARRAAGSRADKAHLVFAQLGGPRPRHHRAAAAAPWPLVGGRGGGRGRPGPGRRRADRGPARLDEALARRRCGPRAGDMTRRRPARPTLLHGPRRPLRLRSGRILVRMAQRAPAGRRVLPDLPGLGRRRALRGRARAAASWPALSSPPRALLWRVRRRARRFTSRRWIASLSYTSVAASVLLVNTAPLFTARLLAASFLGETPGRVGAAARWAWPSPGAALDRGRRLGRSGADSLTGDRPLALAGAVTLSLYHVIGRGLREALPLRRLRPRRLVHRGGDARRCWPRARARPASSATRARTFALPGSGPSIPTAGRPRPREPLAARTCPRRRSACSCSASRWARRSSPTLRLRRGARRVDDRRRRAGARRAGPRRPQRERHDRAPHVHVLFTGGTISMRVDPADGRAPCPPSPARRSSRACPACGRKRASPSRTTPGCPGPTSRPTGCGGCADRVAQALDAPRRGRRRAHPRDRHASKRRRSCWTSRSRATSPSSSAAPCARSRSRAGTGPRTCWPRCGRPSIRTPRPRRAGGRGRAGPRRRRSDQVAHAQSLAAFRSAHGPARRTGSRPGRVPPAAVPRAAPARDAGSSPRWTCTPWRRASTTRSSARRSPRGSARPRGGGHRMRQRAARGAPRPARGAGGARIPVRARVALRRGGVVPAYGYEGGGRMLRDMGIIMGGEIPGPKARILLMAALGLTIGHRRSCARCSETRAPSAPRFSTAIRSFHPRSRGSSAQEIHSADPIGAPVLHSFRTASPGRYRALVHSNPTALPQVLHSGSTGAPQRLPQRKTGISGHLAQAIHRPAPAGRRGLAAPVDPSAGEVGCRGQAGAGRAPAARPARRRARTLPRPARPPAGRSRPDGPSPARRRCRRPTACAPAGWPGPGRRAP